MNKWTPESVKAALMDSIRRLGHVPTSLEYSNLNLPPHRKTIEKVLGKSFNECLREIGFEPTRRTPKRYTSEDLIRALVDFNEREGRSPTSDDFRRLSRKGEAPDPLTYQRRFGTWDEALRQAGLRSNKTLDRDFLKAEVRRYIETYGRVPTRNELVNCPGFPSRKPYNREFGSVNQCLTELGYTPPCTTRAGQYGKRTLAMDGHICDSAEEALIDDALTELGIAHETQKCYPRHPELNEHGMRRCDFYVDGVYVEYAGMITNRSYRKQIEAKARLADELGVDQLVIYPHQLSYVRRILADRFADPKAS